MAKIWKIYLSGEVHSNWRAKITSAAKKARLPIEFYAPVTNHSASDDCGVKILGEEPNKFWHDHKGAKINAIRTRTLIEDADIAIIRFGDKYKQWNAAFDAGYAAALNIPVIVQHPKEFTHALKELDAAAYAVCETVEQVIRILKYVTKEKL
jgi:YtoQ family protein